MEKVAAVIENVGGYDRMVCSVKRPGKGGDAKQKMGVVFKGSFARSPWSERSFLRNFYH